MSDCPINYKSISNIWYVDNTFLLFSSELYMTKFSNYMNSEHQNIKFTVEGKENNSLFFLDKIFFRESWKFHTSVYGKPTICGSLSNLEIFCPYRTNMILFPPCYVVVL